MMQNYQGQHYRSPHMRQNNNYNRGAHGQNQYANYQHQGGYQHQGSYQSRSQQPFINQQGNNNNMGQYPQRSQYGQQQGGAYIPQQTPPNNWSQWKGAQNQRQYQSPQKKEVTPQKNNPFVPLQVSIL